MRLLTILGIAGVVLFAASAPAYAQAKPIEGKKPNILVIFGDDIGWSNISAYNMGMMGFRTPNIDRIAKEGVIFTDYYGQQSCTAGRAAFITGQHPFRTGLLKVGLPGAELGLQPQDPTIADLLKNYGYATGKPFKVHLDGYDQRELLAGTGPSKRNEIFYFDDNGNLCAVRVRDWKAHLSLPGEWFQGGAPVPQSFPKIVNLRMDPLEDHVLFDESPMAARWMTDKFWAFVPMQAVVGQFLLTFKDYPQRQKSASFNIDQVLGRLKESGPGGK